MLVATSYVAIEIQLLSPPILKINRDLISHIIIIKQFILFYSAHTITHISVISTQRIGTLAVIKVIRGNSVILAKIGGNPVNCRLKIMRT